MTKIIVAAIAVLLASACSHGAPAQQPASSAPAVAASSAAVTDTSSAEPPDTSSATPSDTSSAEPPDTSSAAPSSGGTCPLVGSDVVAAQMHLAVKSVEVGDDANKCTFHFGGYHGDLEVSYAATGGPDQLDSVRKASQIAGAIFGGIAKAASAPPDAMGVISATPPADVAKVGDDQAFVTEGPVTQFYATKGDAYVEVDGGFLPDGVSRWVILPEVARQVLAAK